MICTRGEFPVWTTVKLSTRVTTCYESRPVVWQVGVVDVDTESRATPDPKPVRFRAIVEKTEVDLVKVKFSELGVRGSEPWQTICARAFGRGLELCPVDLASQLLVQRYYLRMERLLVAMKPIKHPEAPEGKLVVFVVDSTGFQTHLDITSQDEWEESESGLFVRPRLNLSYALLQ